MENDFYSSIQGPSTAEFKDKGSKFLAYAFPINDEKDFKNHLSELKKEHPKANHYCFAYRLGTDGNNFRASDAGEPAGTAGRPILGQIDSKEYTNILIVVIRYFGGTLLGVPGLINAYKTAAALALQVVPGIKKPIYKSIQFDFDYTKLNDVMNWIKKLDGVIDYQEMQLFCTIKCSIPKSKLALAESLLSDWHDMEWKWL